jgi:hypothetical protein
VTWGQSAGSALRASLSGSFFTIDTSSRRVGAVGNAEEIVDSSEDIPSDLSVLRLGERDVVADPQDRSVLALRA